MKDNYFWMMILAAIIFWHFDSKLDDINKKLKELDAGQTIISSQISGVADTLHSR